MNTIYNGKLITQQDFGIGYFNRAFQYGDGLFETIIARNNEIQLLHYHLERLMEGLLVLQIDHQLNLERLESEIVQLLKINNLSNARIKLQVWRSEGGLFTPTNNKAEYLMTIEHFEKVDKIIQKCSFSENTAVTYSVISKFKTCSALHYIVAGIEKNERKLDDLILLNNEGFVAECISSNIFWFKNNNYYTPSLTTGCVDGVMRRHIIATASKNKVPVHTGNYSKQEIIEAESVFISNATGIYPIQKIDSTVFRIQKLKFELKFLEHTTQT